VNFIVLSPEIKRLQQEWRSFINFRSQKMKLFYHIDYSCRVIENLTTNTRNICLSEFWHPKVIDHRKNSFIERTQPLRNFSKRTRAGCTNKSKFNGFLWNFQTAQRNGGQGPHFSPLKLWALLKERWDFRISDWTRLETAYVPIGELSSKKTEET